MKKIFHIGFHKTGTTSLSRFMHDLGFKVLHDVAFSMQYLKLGVQSEGEEGGGIPVDLEPLLGTNLLEGLVGQFDFFSDNPWPLLYHHLDQICPDSRFILTRRNADNWINSLVQHCGTQNTRMRQLIYGYGNPRGHVAEYRKIYIRHNRNVQEYFRARDNLLIIDIEEDNSLLTKKILGFLEIDAPGAEFPVANKR